MNYGCLQLVALAKFHNVGGCRQDGDDILNKLAACPDKATCQSAEKCQAACMRAKTAAPEANIVLAHIKHLLSSLKDASTQYLRFGLLVELVIKNSHDGVRAPHVILHGAKPVNPSMIVRDLPDRRSF